MEFFNGWQAFDADGASVKFYKTEGFIGFDSRECVPPEPMVNAMIALNMISDTSVKVVMVNHKFPAGLIPKIESNFNIEREDLPNGQVKLVFGLKDGATPEKLDPTKTCH